MACRLDVALFPDGSVSSHGSRHGDGWHREGIAGPVAAIVRHLHPRGIFTDETITSEIGLFAAAVVVTVATSTSNRGQIAASPTAPSPEVAPAPKYIGSLIGGVVIDEHLDLRERTPPASSANGWREQNLVVSTTESTHPTIWLTETSRIECQASPGHSSASMVSPIALARRPFLFRLLVVAAASVAISAIIRGREIREFLRRLDIAQLVAR